jgi:tRNA A37 threonylcarbamoyladenosine modification protein TsaB
MARGLALATGAELVGAGSLEIMAAAHPERPVVIAADAGRGAVYLQRFIEAMTDARPRLIETTADALALNVPAGVAIAGPGAARLLELLGRNDPPAAADLQPHAHALAECAARLTPDAHLRPMYIRAADAKPSTPSLFAPALETP